MRIFSPSISARERQGPQPAMRVRRDDPNYQARADAEAAYWAHPPLTAAALEAAHTGAFKRFLDRSYTGDPSTSWMDDLLSRGPFEAAAVLGSTEGAREADWLAAQGSRSLDVYDLSPEVLAKAWSRLRTKRFGVHWPSRRADFFKADLNFVQLPPRRYDVVWTTASLHHVINLEYLFQEVEGSLREGGLFAVHDYIGEPALLYDPRRLEKANEVLRQVPRRFRLVDQLTAPPRDEISPFEAIRSGESLALLQQRFEVVHLRPVDALFPLHIVLRFDEIEREEPALLETIFAAHDAALQDPSLRKCSMYGVFRRRTTGGLPPSSEVGR